MLAATVSLGVQNVLLDVSTWWLIQALVTILAVWVLIRLWYPGQGSRFYMDILKRVFLLLVLIRFAVPVMLIANDLLYQQFLESRYHQSTEVITRAGGELERLSAETGVETPEGSGTGMLDSLARVWSSTVDTVDLSGRLDHMQARAGELIEHLIQLSVVFILQTGLLPVAFLWVFLQVFKRLLRPE
jgi:hypothetical protein